MPKVYPQKIDLFLVADALRQEHGGKITIMGAFAGGQILVAKEATFPVAMPLALLIGFYTGEGHFETKLRISDPNGKPFAQDLPTGAIDKAEGQPMQLMVNFGIFEFPFPGKYRIDALLDDRVYTDYLSVSVGDRPLT